MMEPVLPPRFTAWFERRGWAPRAHQLAMVEQGEKGRGATAFNFYIRRRPEPNS